MSLIALAVRGGWMARASSLMAALVVLAFLPAAAQALPTTKIVVGQSIGGARPGQTAAQVKQALGPPPFAQVGEPMPGEAPFTDWDYSAVPSASVAPAYSLEITLSHGRVAIVKAMAGPYETNGGIGVGSSMTQVQRAYPKAHCFHFDSRDPSAFDCIVRTRLKRRAVDTQFIGYQPNEGAYQVEVEFAGFYRYS